MADGYVEPEDVSDSDAQKVLDFLNAAKTAREIAEAIEIPGERDVGIRVAQRILDKREELGTFTSLQQIADVEQVGPERFSEIVTVLSQSPTEGGAMVQSSEYIPRESGARGSKGVDIGRLQSYLTRFGYLDSPVLGDFGVRKTMAQPAPETLGTFDEQTEQALQAFQRFHGLDVTGVLDEATLELVKKPRCGFPDTAEFVVQGNKWNTNNLRYGFQNFASDLTQNEVRAALSAAHGYWAAVTPLTFTEVSYSQNPELRIRFVTGNHGDGSPFDGPGGVLAHAYYPQNPVSAIAGDQHYDDAETWSVNLPPSGIDLYTVAAHEIGHSLGLAHSTVQGALMYPFYGGPHRFLTQDDIDGIQAIYGAVGQWHHNKTIQRVYVSHHSQNCWAFVQDLGWRKVEPGSPDGVTNMFIALCAARGNGINVSVYVDNNTIRIMYL